MQLMSNDTKLIYDILLNIDLTPMAFHGQDWEVYAADLAQSVYKDSSDQLRASDISQFFNKHLEEFFQAHESKGPKECDRPTYVRDYSPLFLSNLLAICIKPNEVITWTIPSVLDGQLDFIGANLKLGQLIIEGNVHNYAADSCSGAASVVIKGNTGNSVGYRANGKAKIIVEGNVAHFAGDNLQEQAQLTIKGDAGGTLGYYAGGESLIKIWGNAGDLVGESIHDNASIYIKGNAGNDAGYEIHGYAKIVIEGNAGKNLGIFAAHHAMLEVKGKVESIGSVQENFEGSITVGGRQVQPKVSHSTSVDKRPGGKSINLDDASAIYARDVGDN